MGTAAEWVERKDGSRILSCGASCGGLAPNSQGWASETRLHASCCIDALSGPKPNLGSAFGLLVFICAGATSCCKPHLVRRLIEPRATRLPTVRAPGIGARRLELRTALSQQSRRPSEPFNATLLIYRIIISETHKAQWTLPPSRSRLTTHLPTRSRMSQGPGACRPSRTTRRRLPSKSHWLLERRARLTVMQLPSQPAPARGRCQRGHAIRTFHLCPTAYAMR